MSKSHTHIHVDVSQDHDILHRILEKLEAQEIIMSSLSDAVQALTDTIAVVVVKINEDVQHLQDLLGQAQANDVSDAAAIAALQADADATVARLTDATATLAAIDPVSTFPEGPVV